MSKTVGHWFSGRFDHSPKKVRNVFSRFDDTVSDDYRLLDVIECTRLRFSDNIFIWKNWKPLKKLPEWCSNVSKWAHSLPFSSWVYDVAVRKRQKPKANFWLLVGIQTFFFGEGVVPLAEGSPELFYLYLSRNMPFWKVLLMFVELRLCFYFWSPWTWTVFSLYAPLTLVAASCSVVCFQNCFRASSVYLLISHSYSVSSLSTFCNY